MAKLVKNVAVAGTWYGPAYGNADEVPADVAEQITNPSAWEGAPSVELSEPGSADERDLLIAEAKALGVKIHGNERADTIRRKIAEAQAGDE